MKKIICYFFVVIIMLPFAADAQVLDGIPQDSATITFTYGTIPGFIPDTAATPLWQIGHSHKSFFGIDSSGKMTIMTDTLNSYPIDANNWFVIKVRLGLNTIIDVWHKYQTDSGHDGGIVEFSIDHGLTWQNVKGECNTDSLFDPCGWGLVTSNFYSFTDTLSTGEPAFSGSCSYERFSRFQFLWPCPDRMSSGGTGCTWDGIDTFYVRFRFVSDSVANALAGWEIDSIKIENDQYSGGGVKNISTTRPLNTYPNPSYDGIFAFPALDNEQDYTIEVYNAMGQKIITQPYSHSLDLSHYAKGLYFYKVSSKIAYFTGQLFTE